jgi:hypothetical protein
MTTVTVTAAEVNAAVLVAVRLSVAWETTATTGAVKLTVALVALAGETVIPIKAGPEVCTALKVSGVSAGTLGSEPVAKKLPPVPETTVTGDTALTVGAVGALMVTVVAEVETEAPVQLVAVRVKGTTVATATIGAV